MEHKIFETIFEAGAAVIDFAGIVILLWGFILSFVSFMKWEISLFSGKKTLEGAQHIRCMLGTYIMIGLEFMIISDIIQTAISHSKDDLIFLGVIVVLRTTIGFFLGKELEQIKKEKCYFFVTFTKSSPAYVKVIRVLKSTRKYFLQQRHTTRISIF